MIRLLIFSIFFLSNSLADEQGYRFINDIEKNDVMDIEIITDMSQGGYNYISYFSGRISTEYEGFDGKYKFLQTWTDIVSTYRRNDELKVNHAAQKLNGTQFIIISDSTGEFSREGLGDRAREMEDENTAFMFFTSQGNMLHPFGSDSLYKTGDTWVQKTDEHLDEFPGFESADVDLLDENIFTFKKVKTKKGKKIAYISSKGTLNMKMTSITWDEQWEMVVTGNLKTDFQYSITDKKIIKCRMRGTIMGNGTDLEDDSSISFNQNIDMICKTKIK